MSANEHQADEDTSSAAFFDAKYRADPDPWNFASSAYELGRYQATLEALGPGRFRLAVEPGCSVGVLTEKLAAMCDRVEAFDLSPVAAARARERCAHLPQVSVGCGSLADFVLPSACDLLILSEIGYYFTPLAWQDALQRLLGMAQPGTTVLAVHWLGHSPDHRMHGELVHAILNQQPLLRLTHAERHPSFRLDRWTVR